MLTNLPKKGASQNVHHYEYDSDSVREVLESCDADTVLFLGPYDIGFTWTPRSENKDYKAYSAGLINLLHGSEEAGVQRFVYLSSECVFGERYLTPVVEEMHTSPQNTNGDAVALGETVVTSYHDHQRMDTVILRLDHLYMVPSNTRECSDVYTRMCKQALDESRVEINAKIVRSALSLSDAAQAIYQVCAATTHKRQLYNVPSNEWITEAQVGEDILSASPRKIDIVDQTAGLDQCEQLADRYFGEEFQFSARNSLKNDIPRILQKLQSRLKNYGDGDSGGPDGSKSARLWRRAMPFLEALIVFVLVLGAEMVLADVSYFLHVDFFMLYVLLFAIYHGLTLSVFTSVLSMVGYCLTGMDGTAPLALLMDVSTYVWVAQLFIVGMSVGYLHDRLGMVEKDKDEEIDYLSSRLGDISYINNRKVAIKNYFEQQTINSKESMSFFYDIVAQLDAANENEVLFIAVQLLTQAMGTEQAAIYTVANAGFCRLLTSTVQNTHSLGKSIRMSNYQTIMDTLDKEHVFINRNMDDKLPSMSSVLKNNEGAMDVLIFLWELPYDRMTLHYSNMLRILTLLIRSAMERTTRYLSLVTSTRYWQDTNILKEGAFQDIFDVFENASQKGLSEYTMLRIDDITEEGVSLFQQMAHLRLSGQEEAYVQEVAKRLSRSFRQEDYIGYMDDDMFYVLLTNTTVQESQTVLNRLESRGMRASVLPHPDEVRPTTQEGA